MAKSIFKPERCSPLQLCRACTGKSSDCDMWGAASATPADAQGKVLGFQEMLFTRHIRAIYPEDVPNLSEIFMHAPCNL